MQQLNHLWVELRKYAVTSLNDSHINIHVAQVLGKFNSDEARAKNDSTLVGDVFYRSLDVVCISHVAQPKRSFDAWNIESARLSAG